MTEHLNDGARLSTKDALTQQATNLLRHAIALAGNARVEGHHPFAALVVDEHGNIVSTAGNNSRPPDGDPTQHAELVAAAQAAKLLTTQQLAKCTLYSSAEPCCMCAGAIYWCGIGRVIYALSESRLLTLTGSHSENPTFSLPCRVVFESGQRRIHVIGPVLEDEAVNSHIGFWSEATKSSTSYPDAHQEPLTEEFGNPTRDRSSS